MNIVDINTFCKEIKDGETIFFPKNKILDFYSDKCLIVQGYHFSNTASYDENPNGERPVALFVKDRKNITINGNGSTIMIHGIMTPFLFYNCENITLKNITFDYYRPTMSEFLIEKKISNSEYLIKINIESLFYIENNRIIWTGEKNSKGDYFWTLDYRAKNSISMFKDLQTEKTQMLDCDGTGIPPCVPEFESIEVLENNKLKVKLKNKNAFFPVGTVVQTRCTMREQIGGCFENSKNVVMENVKVFAMHGFGILAQFCENVKYNKVQIIPKKGRTIASNADFFQASGCCGKLIIQNCILSDGHDDYINIHGTHLQIIDKNENKIKVRFKNPNSRGFKAFYTGDDIEFIGRTNLIPYGKTKVLNAEKINDTDILLTVDDNNKCKIEDYIENVTKTPEVLIQNNTFGTSMGRGILCTSRKKTIIKNNVFYKNGGNVLCIEDDCNFWFESGYTTDVVFENNTVIGCGYGMTRENYQAFISVFPRVIDDTSKQCVHKKLVIRNNRFYYSNSNSYRFDIRYVENLVIKNNNSDNPIKLNCYCVDKLNKRKIKYEN